MAPASERREESRTSLTSKTQHQVERGVWLDVVVGERLAVLELLAGEDQALLVRRNALLVMDLFLDNRDGVVVLDIEIYRLTSEGLDKELHHDERVFREREREIGLGWVGLDVAESGEAEQRGSNEANGG